MLKNPCWLILAIFLVVSPAAAETPEEDPLALAALLLADGNVDRAASVLSGVDPTDDAVDGGWFWSLSGLVALEHGDHGLADVAFGKSIDHALAVCEADPTVPRPCEATVDPVLFLSQARARLLAGNAAGALDALDRGGPALHTFSGSFLVRARAAEATGDTGAAWDALKTGAEIHPSVRDLPRQQVLLLLRLGLCQEASAQAAALLERDDVGLEDVLAIAEAMRKAGSVEGAAVLLEDARLAYPESVEPLLRLAAVHMDAGRPLTAGRFLQQAAEWDARWALASAELYRKAGRRDLSLYMNSRVEDPTEKVRQRFGLLLDDGAFERAVALDDRLVRLGLLQSDEALRYGLAYAWFRVGDMDRAEGLLSGFADARLFENAVSLRQAIARCRDSPETCG